MRRTGTVLFLLLGFFLSLSALPAGAAVAGKISVLGLHSFGRSELLDLLDLKEGAYTDAEQISKGIKRAFLKGVFDDISVETDEGDPAAITVRVRERDIISRIRLLGDYRLSAKTVRNLLLFKEDEAMRYDLIDEARRDLGQKYADSGYPGALISIETAGTGRPYRVDLLVSVEPGPPVLVRKIKVSDNGVVSHTDFRISEGDVYDQFRIKNELLRVRERLRKEGYYHPEVGPYGYHDGDLFIAVDPGKQLRVTVHGNSSVSTKDLMREVPFFEVESFSDEIVDEAVNRMLALYRKEGYPFAQIAPVVKDSGKESEVTFFVFEGNRIAVGTISFSGNTIAGQGLKNVMDMKEKGRYNPDLEDRDKEKLTEFYNALGYLEASVRKFEAIIHVQTLTADIAISIDEGARTTISSIEIQGAEPSLVPKLLSDIAIQKGDPYNEVDISDARFRILDYYANEGYANIDVAVRRSIQRHSAAILFAVSGGERTTIGKTIITGNRSTRYEVIKRELQSGEGGAYSFRTLAQERQRLYKLGLFTDVEIEARDTGKFVNDLLVRVREGNAGFVEFGFGYAEYEQFRGYAEVGYRNLWGLNRQGMLRTELSSLEQRIILQYYEPWAFGRRLPFRALFTHENRKEITIPGRQVRYRLDRYSLSAGVERTLSHTLKTELYYDFSLVSTTDVQPDVVLSKEDVGTLAISSIRTSLVYDTRDNPFDPARGVLAGLTLKAASPLLFSETNFVKITIHGSLFHQLHRRIILALSARGGLAFGFGATNELPIVERFFLGGRSSVRGYEQDGLGPKGQDGNSQGGNAFAMGSIELRANLGKGFGLVPFFDFGNVWAGARDFSASDIRFTTGLGLRYATPVGPLRVDYGYKLNKDKGDRSSEIHFSVGHAF
jgi:outer membrane protein insertion porin family